MELRLDNSSEDNLESIDWDEVYNLTYNGPLILAKDSNTPTPWDALISISKNGKDVIISGAIGANGFGECTCSIPKEDFHDVYHYYV